MRRRDESIRPPEGADPSVFLPLPHLPFHILLALSEQPRHGWGILKVVEEIQGGSGTPSSGSLYLAISRLEERGLLEEAPAPGDGDGRRRYVALTPLGRRVLAAETERLGALVDLADRWGVRPATPTDG